MTAKPQKKPKIVYDTFEQVAELGKDTICKSVQEVAKTFNPFASSFENPTKSERQKGNNKFTELNFDELQSKYDKQDASQLDEVRKQLKGSSQESKSPEQLSYDYHTRVRREEEEYLAKKEQEEEEEKRQEAYKEQQKQQIEDEKQRQQGLETPKGKVRKSILGVKGHQKSSTELPAEHRPGAGKQ